jgi:hypothetical protein
LLDLSPSLHQAVSEQVDLSRVYKLEAGHKYRVHMAGESVGRQIAGKPSVAQLTMEQYRDSPMVSVAYSSEPYTFTR